MKNRKVLLASCLLFVCLGLTGIGLHVLRGSGHYIWIQTDQHIGIMRTDTKQTIMLPGFQANITPQRNILESTKTQGLSVTFHDQSTLPGRVTLQFKQTIIDVMEKGITYNQAQLPWK